MPFGEELGASVGGRTTGMGFSVTDGLRQKFTQKERDIETGLDYFGARYYGSMQGRFTGVDPIYVTLERLIDPQRLNLYSYVRNNPVVFVDPDGMDLIIDAKTEEEARKKFALFQKGLTVADRKHTSFSVGDGKNGYEKGKFYALVEKDHKSDSGNFQAIQAIANDRGEKAFVAIVGPKDTFASQVGVKEGDAVIVKSFKGIFGQDNYVSRKDAVPGQTLFPLRTTPIEGGVYSTDNNTHVYVATDQPDVEVVATAYHELRAHVFLSNMGRDIPKGLHGYPGVNQAGKAAENEAKRNFSQRVGQPRRRR
jgi:RHS repeat-associated protein